MKYDRWGYVIELAELVPTVRIARGDVNQIQTNIDLSLLKIALAALVKILQTSVNISPNRPEKQLISRYNNFKESINSCHPKSVSRTSYYQ